MFASAQVLTLPPRLHSLSPLAFISGGRPLDVGVVLGMGLALTTTYVMMMVMLFLEGARVVDDDELRVRASWRASVVMPH